MGLCFQKSDYPTKDRAMRLWDVNFVFKLPLQSTVGDLRTSCTHTDFLNAGACPHSESHFNAGCPFGLLSQNLVRTFLVLGVIFALFNWLQNKFFFWLVISAYFFVGEILPYFLTS